MKKTLLLLLVLASVANAAPRFGIVAEQNNGAGAIITDDMYTAQLTYTSQSDDSDSETSVSGITLSGNYKIALDSVTALTVGASYQTISGDVLGSEIDTYNTIAIQAGFERALSSNIVLTTQADIYSTETLEVGGNGETATTSIFSNGRVGVAYLF
tara:strand:- start:177 stop:644 length:468 start_codon:yes stop_codon:yes gene_type:complete